MAKLKIKIPKLSLGQLLTIREKVIFAVALFGIFMFFVNNIWSPLSGGIRIKKGELNNYMSQTDGLKRLIENTNLQLSVQTQVPKEETKVDEKGKLMLERRVMDSLGEIHSTVGEFSSRTVAKGIKIEDVSIGEVADRGNYSVVPLSIHLEGKFGAVLSFFETLENFDHPLIVRRFALKRGAEETGVVKGSIDVELYIIKR